MDAVSVGECWLITDNPSAGPSEVLQLNFWKSISSTPASSQHCQVAHMATAPPAQGLET